MINAEVTDVTCFIILSANLLQNITCANCEALNECQNCLPSTAIRPVDLHTCCNTFKLLKQIMVCEYVTIKKNVDKRKTI